MGEKDDNKGNCPEGDVISLGPDLGGVRPYVRHQEDHSIQTGFARPVKEGESLSEGAFFLKHRPGHENEYNVEPVLDKNSTGPARVTTNAYRTGWDNIFGGKSPVGQA